MNNQQKCIYVVLLVVFSLSSCSTKQPAEEVQSSIDDAAITAPFASTATFNGFIPCENCLRIDISLTIRPDTMYQLRKTYRREAGPSKVEAQVGKWVYLPKDRLLVLGKQKGLLKTYFIENEKTLKFIEWEGTDKTSQIQYQLVRSDQVDPFDDIVKISGNFSIVDGVGIIRECASGQSFAVRDTKDYPSLLQNYMNTPHYKGQPLLTNIWATFAPAQGGQSEIVVEQFRKITAEEDCQGKKVTQSLTGTLWQLEEVDGRRILC